MSDSAGYADQADLFRCYIILMLSRLYKSKKFESLSTRNLR